MGRYTDFSLLWTNFSGYSDRQESFGVPTTVCIFGKGDHACRINTWREHAAAGDLRDLAAWHNVPTETLRELRQLLTAVGAYGEIQPLIEADGDGPYFVSWEFIGTDMGRPFHFSVEWTTPGEVWTPNGERFRKVIGSSDRRGGSPAA